MTISRGRAVAVAVAAVVLAGVLVGVYLAGSPAEARLRRMDERRIADLREVHYSINVYWTRFGRLPLALDSLPPASEGSFRYRDPASGEAYIYLPSADSAYQLCADFARISSEDGRAPRDDAWQHGAGRQCFQLVASRVSL